MKNFIFIILFSFSSLLGYSQILNEDFESAPDNADASGVWTMNSGNWSVRDNRTNANPNWRKNVNPFPANSGVKAAYIDRENTGPGVLAEEWLITPQRPITANSQLRFFTRQTLAGDDSSAKYQIRVSSGADQNDLAAYTILKEYTETELSTITADQLDYEEKIIDLSFTGPRYFAFVRVTTQPGLATGGDRWLVDDVKIVERCLEPTVLTIETATISATTTKLIWNGPGNTEFQVQYGPTGFVLDVAAPFVVISPVFTSNTTPRYYLATDLQPNTGYQFYVRSVCTDSNSIWVGPFNWNTKPLGSICSAPIIVTPLPYSDSSNTTIYGNNIINGTPGNTGCGAGGGFLGGNDVVYSYTPTVTGNLAISMDPQGSTNTGIFVYANCASIGSTCIGGVGNATANIRVIPSLAVTAGQPIFIVISSTTATPNFAYTLSIQEATCPQPMTLSTSNLGTTSAMASWVNGTESTATSWEIAVQPAGATIPTVAGIQTNINTNYPITTTLSGAPLAASTCYQYWVRADCGNGVFSPWSGPFSFCTTGCEISNQCNYTFTLTDTGGNGWNGGRMQVIQNGLVVSTLGATITAGTATVIVPLCNNQPFSLFWSVAGTAPDEIRINIKNGFTQTIYAMTTNSQALIGTTLYTGTVDCLNPLCLQPTANPTVPAATITFNNAVVNWNVAGTSTTTTTGWEIYVVTQGSPAPDLTTIATYNTTGAGPAVSFTIPVGDLLPDTNYTVYVRALCSVNSPSPWTGGANFKTKEQCPKPTALTATLINPFGATLGWTNATGTNWQILIQLASLPDPAPNDPAWTNTNGGGGAGPTFTYLATGLTPETAYEFYIRTDCGGVILSNPAGPRAFTTGVSCPKPTTLGTNTLTPYGGTFTWTSPGTAFEVIVLPAGSPAPVAGDTGIAATPSPYVYNGPALTPETNYIYYVRNICGGINGVSTWAGPKAFLTTPTCFKPTNFLAPAAGLQAFQVQLTWNSVATTTAWQILAQAPGDPAPTAASTGWVTINPGDAGAGPLFSYNYTGLTPETAYVFYIRGNCGAADGTSTWTGPRAATTKPSCYKPTALTATDITPFTASLGWTNNPLSPVTEWQILIVAQGATAPTTAQTGNVITQNAYPAIGLTPNTCYDYYVRSSCGGVDGLSTWSGPKNFCTIPTCPQPTGLSAANGIEPNADLSWTGPGNAGQWQVIVQAPSGTVPGANTTTGTIVSVPTINTGVLEPGFYEFYVRAICSDTDKSFWSGPFNFFIATTQPVCASVEINVTTTSPGVIDLCPGENCIDLVANFTDSKDTTTYTVLPVGFAPPFPFTGGTQLPVTTDDVWSAPFTLPFNFCFYGVNYPKVNVGSNGVITFNNQAVGDNCAWNTDPGVTIPNPAFPIRNAIYGVYQDIDPSVNTGSIVRSINYQVLGVAPCRAFVVNYYNIGQFSCGTDVGLQTSQIVLYETSNIIEVYVQDRTVCTNWNEGSGVIGIQNAAGTFAHFPPGRNLGPWEAHNEAWRFTPNGASNVVFSWLKDGAFYSNAAAINVCVSETTNMTAKAVYTGCGGQITTKTEDVLLRINEVVIPPIPDVQACISYTLPALTIGNYFNQPGGIDPIDITIPITGLGEHLIYVYGVTTSIPPCPAEISFTVTIGDLIAPTLAPVAKCTNYTLPALDIPFNYYQGPDGTGTMYSGLGGDVISSTQDLYIYGQSGTCTAQSILNITIDTLQLGTQSPISGCSNFFLPDTLPPNNSYYTQTGGPNGSGVLLNPGTEISESQTIYIYAESGTCSDEGSFTVDVFGVAAPTLEITPPTCLVSTATIEVTDPVATGGTPIPANLFISEVVDSNAGSLTYVELFNGTGAPVDLSNYKLKMYNNGGANPATNCNMTLSGIIANNDTFVIKVSPSANQIPDANIDLTFTSCLGINVRDNIRLTTLNDVEIDLWGRTDNIDFTPNNQAGYTYRRISTAPIPSLVWNPADWTAIDPEDYSDVGLYTQFVAYVYQYNIDGGPWQYTTTFNDVPIGPHVINIQEIATGCTNFTNVDIVPQFDTVPVTTFSYLPTPTVVCNNAANLTPDTSATGFVIGGSYTANPNTLVIDLTTGVIDVAASAPGDYTVTYTVDSDLANCISGGHTDYPITINPILTPDFAEFINYCPGAVVPTLNATSPNGVVGTWFPSVIDNQNGGSYVFTPDSGQCAVSRTYNVVIKTPTIVPTFDAIPEFCSGTTPIPALATTSLNTITGSWSPATISNTQTADYVFTPDGGQCALPITITVTVNDVETPNFGSPITICSGTTAPTLETTSPNEIEGTWSPSVINPTESGMYVFTPTPVTGRCFNNQTIEVTVGANPVFDITAGCINGNYTLTVTSNSNFETATYIWKDSAGTVIGGNTSSIVVSQPGDYTCEVTYQGCSAPQTKSVTTISCTIQKGISPKGTGDGDGLNDYFDLEGQNVTKLEIFNRYGSKVYTKSNYSKEWYGQSDNGDELPDGTYFYVIERNGEKSRTGWIYINHEL